MSTFIKAFVFVVSLLFCTSVQAVDLTGGLECAGKTLLLDKRVIDSAFAPRHYKLQAAAASKSLRTLKTKKASKRKITKAKKALTSARKLNNLIVQCLTGQFDKPTLLPVKAQSDIRINLPKADDIISIQGVRDIYNFCPPIHGDYNQDFRVDGADFLVWQRNFGRTDATGPLDGDGTRNGIVNENDLTLWKENYGKYHECGTSDAVITPGDPLMGIINHGYANASGGYEFTIEAAPGSNATHYTYKIHQHTALPVDTSLATVCDSDQNYGGLASFSVPAILPPRDPDLNYYVTVCVRGMRVTDNEIIGGAVNAYVFLHDGRNPVFLTNPPQPGEGDDVNLSWGPTGIENGALASAISYDIKISPNLDCSSPIASIENTLATSAVVDGLQTAPAGTYYLCITGTDAAGNTTTNPPRQFSIGTAPGEFAITGPEHQQTDDEFTLIWTPSAGADSYEIKLASTPDCSASSTVQYLTETERLYENFGEATVYFCLYAISASGKTPAANNPYEVSTVVYLHPQTIFVTKLIHGVDEIDFGDIPLPQLFYEANEADFHCTHFAYLRGWLPGWDRVSRVFRAMITSAFTDLPQRAAMGQNVYVNTNGQVVAANRTQLFSGVFTNPILTEEGNVLAGANVPIWTGSNNQGLWVGSDYTCSNWTTYLAPAGYVGNLNGGNSTFLNNGTRACHLGARLICVGVRQD